MTASKEDRIRDLVLSVRSELVGASKVRVLNRSPGWFFDLAGLVLVCFPGLGLWKRLVLAAGLVAFLFAARHALKGQLEEKADENT